MTAQQESSLLVQLLFDWIEQRTGSRPGLVSMDDITLADLAGQRLAIAVESASSEPVSPDWQSRSEVFASLVAGEAEPGVLIWLPPGGDIPSEEPDRSHAVQQLQSAISRLQPGESADAGLPIEIGIQKRDDQGAYVSAFGGLSAHWARFTDRVQGYLQIDSTALHRLPAEASYLDELVDRLVEASKGLALGQTAQVDALDHWRVQRLGGGRGAVVVGLPPEDVSENGAPLRKRLRRAVRDANARLDAENADARVVLLVGHFATVEGEPVGPALRGQDPALFAGLDLVALAADGQMQALLDITRQPLLQAQPGTASGT